MDETRFDELTRALATRRTRRGVLGSLVGLVVGTIGLGASSALAACPTGQVAISGGRCVCKSTMRPPGPSGCPAGPGQTLCNGVAVDYSSDVNNCGACGYACPPASSVGACAGAPVCRASTCIYSPLPAGTVCRPAVDQCDAEEVCDGTNLACPADAKAPAGTACNDGNLCTENDRCNGAGACVGTPKVCSGDQCNDGVCRTSDGACIKSPKPNGTSCNDGNLCTQTDTCQNGQCVGGSPTICQPLDACHVAGTCDPASGQCSNPAAPQGTLCGSPASCSAGSQHLADICNASGTCIPGATTSCGLYVCNGTTCRTTCSDDDHCIGAAHCEGGQCVNDGANGAGCDSNGDCTSGICNTVSNICCSQTCGAGVGCTGPNQTCTPACTPNCTGKACGASDDCGGTCQTGSCPVGQTCNAGTCVGTVANGGACTTDGQCQSGICNPVNHICCSQICGSGVGCAGTNNTCSPSTCGATGQVCCPNNSCDSGVECNARGTCGPCGAQNETCCAGNHCDGALVCDTWVTCQPACGANGQTCCLNNACNAGLTCDVFTNSTCTACGAQGQLCCNGTGCNNGLGCTTAGTCGTCGALDQACCAGNVCGNGLTCDVAGGRICRAVCVNNGGFCNGDADCCSGDCNAIGTCEPCGRPGEACCAGIDCWHGDSGCYSDTKICGPCGGEGQPCCEDCFFEDDGTLGCRDLGDDACAGDMQCITEASGRICRECGEIGQPCCPTGDVACDSGTVCTNLHVCAASCGGNGEPCCEQHGGFSRSCDSGFTCANGLTCEPCGGLNLPCCLNVGDVACGEGTTCGQGNICQACGHLGEHCCPGPELESLVCLGGLTCTQQRMCEDWS